MCDFAASRCVDTSIDCLGDSHLETGLIHRQIIQILVDKRLDLIWLKEYFVKLLELVTSHPYGSHTMAFHSWDIEFDGSTFFGSSHEILI